VIRFFSQPIPLVFLLLFLGAIGIIMGSFRLVQIPTGQLPEDSLRLLAAPVSIWLHSLAGIVFCVTGPLQFARALKVRFGKLHRLLGRIFVIAGIVLGLSSMSLLVQLVSMATPLVDIARAFFGATLIATLVMGVRAARGRNIAEHRAWMIRSYAIGVGGTSVGLVMFPIYLAGGPVTGLIPDMVFVGWWLITIGISQWVIVYIRNREGRLETHK
jgi:uncharacterized membrane protein